MAEAKSRRWESERRKDPPVSETANRNKRGHAYVDTRHLHCRLNQAAKESEPRFHDCELSAETVSPRLSNLQKLRR